MSGGRRVRVATVGFQGFGNLGDEAILVGIERLLDRTDLDVVTVFSGPQFETIEGFMSAERVVTWRHLPTLRAFRRLRRVDLLLISGGGLFNDHWRAVVPRYAAWVLAARLAGARVAWVGVGVGPLDRGWARWLTRQAARASDIVLVRDSASASILGRGVRCQVIPDPSLFIPSPAAARGQAGVAIVVRGPTERHARVRGQLLQALADVGLALRGRGLEPTFLTMAGSQDRPFSDALTRELRDRQVGDIVVEALGSNVSEAIERLGEFRSVVSVRLHGMLLSAVAGVMSVPIGYDDKVMEAAAELGLEKDLVSIDRVSAASILLSLDRSLATDPAVLRERVEGLRSQRDHVGARIEAFAQRADR